MKKKDPAFLFYPQDFITGTMFFTNEQAGIYVKLLCSQHQHGGLIDKDSFREIVGKHEIIKAKFIETEDGFFNVRMMKEIEKRNKKSANMSANAHKRWDIYKQKQCKSIASAMPPEDVNEIEVVNSNVVPQSNLCGIKKGDKSPYKYKNYAKNNNSNKDKSERPTNRGKKVSENGAVQDFVAGVAKGMEAGV